MARIPRFPAVIPFNVHTGRALGHFPKRGTESLENGQYDYNRKEYIPNEIPLEWKENPTFEAALKFKEVGTTYSGTPYITLVIPETEEEFSMRTTTFNECMTNMTWILGVAKTTWTYERSGNNCYIAPAYLRVQAEATK